MQIFPTLPDPSLHPQVLIYASSSLQAQINSMQNFPYDPDCQAASVTSKNFNFNLVNIYNDTEHQLFEVAERSKFIFFWPVPSQLSLSDLSTMLYFRCSVVSRYADSFHLKI
jgi:hypothetical protein